MEDYIKTLLAQQVYNLCDKEYYTYVENKKITQTPVLTVVKKLYEQGVSSLTYIPTAEPEQYSCEPLLLSLLKNNNLSPVTQYALEQLSPQEFQALDGKTQNTIMKNAIGDDPHNQNIKVLFEKGWRLHQDASNNHAVEIECAMSGNLFFFETLVAYQPDVNFNLQYNVANEKLTLMEMIEEDLPYVQNSPAVKRMENTLCFLKSYASYTEMQKDLPNNQPIQPKVKI